MSTIIKRIGDSGYVHNNSCVHTFEISGAIKRVSDLDNTNPLAGTSAWDERPISISGIRLLPRGAKNNMPEENRDLLENSNTSPSTLERKKRLLWMQGPALFDTEYVEGKPQRIWKDDPEIWAWLSSWDFEEYLDRTITDFLTDNKYASMFIRNRAPRISGAGMINKLEHKMNFEIYPEWPSESGVIPRIFIGNYTNQSLFELKPYPSFVPDDPFKYPLAIYYYNSYTYGRKHYSVPSWHGTKSWIKVGSDVPKILSSLNNNMLTVKYHIKSPKSYWDEKQAELEKQCSLNGIQYTSKMLDDLKDQMFSDLAEMLSGVDNVGKFFDSEYVTNAYGKLEGWEIEPIDMKVKDFITSQINIAKRSDFAIASGMGLAPSLSNLSMDGNLSSGSEQLYALKLHLSTDVDLPESKVTKAINYAIRANFPGKSLKLGFYHEVVKKEEDVTPSNRVTNIK